MAAAPAVDNSSHLHTGRLVAYNAKGESFSIALSKLLKINQNRERDTIWAVEAEKITRKGLQNYEDAFLNLWGDSVSTPGLTTTGPPQTHEDTRDWVQKRVGREQQIYMIVKITTATNCRVTALSSDATTDAIKAGIPVKDIISHVDLPWRVSTPTPIL